MSANLENTVFVLRAYIVVTFMVLSSPLASAYSCRNTTPVHKTLDQYARRAVFTARLVRSIGGVYETRSTSLPHTAAAGMEFSSLANAAELSR